MTAHVQGIVAEILAIPAREFTQVTKGMGAMPAFGGRLSAEDIETVANYVLAQAEKGW